MAVLLAVVVLNLDTPFGQDLGVFVGEAPFHLISFRRVNSLGALFS
jgi:hypothetical protein